MKVAYLWLAPVALAFGTFGGCGGDADSGNSGAGAAAGASTTGKGGNSGSGGSNSSSGGQVEAGGAPSGELCNDAECGPGLGIPSQLCDDGSFGGPTGRCLQSPSGACFWEIRTCPPAGEGGAGSGGAPSGGGASNSAGGAASDQCGGCDASANPPEICIFQAGGPGPGRFTCAKQNPCGAAGACACIIGQGTCEFELMGGSPGYCVCDNGLD